jgi:glycosyltransferase involved in cell wall biosynthesis
MNPEVTVIVPCYNEAETLQELHREIVMSLEAEGRSYEILFIDDGSTDASWETMSALVSKHAATGAIRLRRNFGKAAALDCGFRRARGALVVTLDADLQDRPAEIPRLLAEIETGFDVVSGWKRERNDPWTRTFPSWLFNRTVAVVSGLKMRDMNSGLKAYRREATETLHLYGEMHRFIPVLLHWQGFSVSEIPVEHRPRRFGQSKYGISRLGKGFFDLLTVLLNTQFHSRPLHYFGLAGAAVGGLGFLILLYLVVLWFMGVRPIGNRPLLLLGALMVMVGIQLVSTGLLGELVARGQQMERPAYAIRTIIEPGHPNVQLHEVSDRKPSDATHYSTLPEPGVRQGDRTPPAEDRGPGMR